MTDDIVARLRTPVEDPFFGPLVEPVKWEAADEIERLRNEKNNMIEATKKFVESAQKANDTIDNLWVETQDKHLARIAELVEALQECEPFVAHFKGGWCTLTHAQISTDELLETIRAALAKHSQTS